MKNLYKIIFLNFLFIGTLISISSYSWFSMWMGLEINLMSIIPLMNSYKNIFPSESALKYFITQAMASTIILFSIILMMKKMDIFTIKHSLFMMMNSAILTKMGAAPFHFWFPEIMEGLNWMNCLIMLTWQKFAPMIIFSYMNFSNLTIWIIIISSMISGVMGLNQTSMRKILTFSSINHIGWMLASMSSNLSIWLIYFLIYSIISINLIIMFNIYNIFFIKQFINSMNSNKLFKLSISINFLSLGGLPPFLGFFPKWLTINSLININFYWLSMILIISTLITLFFYLRVIFSSFLMKMSETLNLNYNKFIYSSNILNILNLLGLIMNPMIFIYL